MNNGTGYGKKPTISRRQLLKFTVGVSIGGGAAFLATSQASANEASCADLDDIFALYGSLNYSVVSPVEGKVCGNCVFFDQNGTGDCRHCEMMVAPADITGYCDAWSVSE